MKIGETGSTGSYNNLPSKSKASAGAQINTTDTFRSVSGTESVIDLKKAAKMILKQQVKNEEPLWKYRGNKTLFPSLVGKDGKLFVAHYDHSIMAFDSKTGKKIWDTGMMGPLEHPVTRGEDGKIYGTCSWLNYIYALDENNGDIKWAHEVGKTVSQTPVPGKHKLVYLACDYEGRLIAYDSKKGKMKWDINLREEGSGGSRVFSPLVNSKGNLLVGTGDGSLYAVDGKKGKIYGKTDTGEQMYHAPLMSNDGKSVFLTGYEGGIFKIDADTGKEIWRKRSPGNLGTAVISEKDNTLVVGCYDGKLRSYNGETGELLWEKKMGEGSAPKPGAFHPSGFVLVGTDQEKISAIDLKTGEETWSAKPGSDHYGPPLLGPDDTIYVAGGYEKDRLFDLYAIKLPDYVLDPEKLEEKLGASPGTTGKDIEVGEKFVVIGGVKLSKKQLAFMGINAEFYMKDPSQS